MSEPVTPPTVGGRRGWTLRQRLAAPDSYGLLLALILVLLVLTPVVDRWAVGRVLGIALTAVVLLFALHTSRAGRRLRRIALGCVIVSIAVGTVTAVVGSAEGSKGIGAGFVALLTLATLVAIVARVGTHPTISGSTVFAALCIYLLFGLLYASTFSFLDVVYAEPVLAGAVSEPLTSVDYLYFSFVTLTTVGYGDVTATQDVARMLAVSEALLGQLYLVTVVALVVANIGRARRPRDG